MSARAALTCGLAVAWAVSAAGQSTIAKRKDGQPDIAGYYQMFGTAGSGGLTIEPLPNPMQPGRTAPGIVLDPPDGLIPYLPWARVRRDEVRSHYTQPTTAQVDTRNRGWPDGVPRINFYFVNPFQIVQPDGAMLFLYEAQHEFRYIPLDRRPQVDNGVKLWMGSSRGRWEGNTLVVDVTNHSDRVRFSVVGDFASDGLKVTERWTWADPDTIHYKATLEDPKVFSRPWTAGVTLKRINQPGFELMEYSGVEGEKDAHLMVDIPAALKQKEQEKK